MIKALIIKSGYEGEITQELFNSVSVVRYQTKKVFILYINIGTYDLWWIFKNEKIIISVSFLHFF